MSPTEEVCCTVSVIIEEGSPKAQARYRGKLLVAELKCRTRLETSQAPQRWSGGTRAQSLLVYCCRLSCAYGGSVRDSLRWSLERLVVMSWAGVGVVPCGGGCSARFGRLCMTDSYSRHSPGARVSARPVALHLQGVPLLPEAPNRPAVGRCVLHQAFRSHCVE